MTVCHCVFRLYLDPAKRWVAHCLDYPTQIEATQLCDAVELVKKDVAALTATDPSSVELVQYLEHLSRPAHDGARAIWVRQPRLDPTGSSRLLARRDWAEHIRVSYEALDSQVFSDEEEASADGTVVIVAGLPDDRVDDIVAQVGLSQRIVVVCPVGPTVEVRVLFTADAPAARTDAVTLSSLQLRPNACLVDLFAASPITDDEDPAAGELLID